MLYIRFGLNLTEKIVLFEVFRRPKHRERLAKLSALIQIRNYRKSARGAGQWMQLVSRQWDGRIQWRATKTQKLKEVGMENDSGTKWINWWLGEIRETEGGKLINTETVVLKLKGSSNWKGTPNKNLRKFNQILKEQNTK